LIDPRTLVPFDLETVAVSLDHTNRLVVVQEASPGGSWGASLVGVLAERRFEMFDAPPRLVAGDETPIPYAGPLEEAWLPSVERICATVRETVEF
jgi:pyruvate dehydrogenase E1 component beta subunit